LTDAATTKDVLRAQAKDRRAGLQTAVGGQEASNQAITAQAVAAQAITALNASPLAATLEAGKIIAGYMPIGTEFDALPMMDFCLELGLRCAVPTVEDTSTGRLLVFRQWDRKTPMAPGLFGIAEPSPQTDKVVPDFLFVPLLAADRNGWRIGYGAGYYDTAIRALRSGRRGQSGGVTAVGLCYEGQLVDTVPHHSGDERLDWIVTEAGVIECRDRSR
jgi:5-formyltetrahydrofolate cyclo-ligase